MSELVRLRPPELLRFALEKNASPKVVRPLKVPRLSEVTALAPACRKYFEESDYFQGQDNSALLVLRAAQPECHQCGWNGGSCYRSRRYGMQVRYHAFFCTL